ncbi:hypothetical protein, partial [Pseudomonas lundensis]
WGEHSRLNECPVSLDHYNYLVRQFGAFGKYTAFTLCLKSVLLGRQISQTLFHVDRLAFQHGVVIIYTFLIRLQLSGIHVLVVGVTMPASPLDFRCT